MFLCNKSSSSDYCRNKMLGAIIGKQIRESVVINSEIFPEYFTGKKSRMDINMTFNNGSKANLELQLKCHQDEERKRAVYYAAKLYASSIKEGQNYSDIPDIYQVFIIDFIIFNDDVLQHTFMYKDQFQNVLTETSQIIFIELPKLEKRLLQNKDENLNELEFWCTLLLCGKNPHFYTRLEQLSTFREDLTMADDSWKNISQEERDWAYKLSIEGGALDYDVDMRYAERRGFKEGAEKKAIENARNLLKMNLGTVEQISQAINLPLEEVLKIKEELKQTSTISR